MPQSYASLYYHIVFSMKDHLPQITGDIAERLYGYIGGVLRQNGGVLIKAGGIEDHIHLLATLSKQQSVSEALRIIKTNSSRRVHETFPEKRLFAWQSGYGIFSVSASGVDRVIRYIANQHDHHRVETFREEYIRFLKEYNIPYDERYIWE